ncbi:MAG: Gfo/Idh/MocA family oxidoreductase [Oscillospiraceae bacterium]|jgi:predicted dehydrogenase|nr:Gfo/Idh/MocA family oxidoreductase [Oscillospiraceae bacterium]
MNIALIGFGYWGPNIARNIAACKKTTLYAVCDSDPQRLERAGNIYRSGSVRLLSDYRGLLFDPAVDAVAIATNTGANHRLALEAVAAGKHIFIEKPMTSTLAEAVEVGAAAERAGVIIHVDHIMLYNRVIAYIKDMLDNGILGELLYYDSSRMNLGPIRRDVNAMTDLAVHDLAVIDYLSGGKTPQSVTAVGGRGYGRQEALTYLTMKYQGFIAHLRSSWMSPVKERRMIIGGTKKMLVFDDVKSIDKLTVYDSGIEVTPAETYGEYEYKVRAGDIHIPFIGFEDSLLASVGHFAECVENNVLSRSSHLQAIRVIEILEQAQKQLQK